MPNPHKPHPPDPVPAPAPPAPATVTVMAITPPTIAALYLFDLATGRRVADVPDSGIVDLTSLPARGATCTLGVDVAGAYGAVRYEPRQANGPLLTAFTRGNRPPLYTRDHADPAGAWLRTPGTYVVNVTAFGNQSGWLTNRGPVRPFNISITAGVTPDPIPVNGIVLTDPTIATPPWANRDGKTVMLRRGGTYTAPKAWGDCHAQGFTLCAEPGDGALPRLVFEDPTAGAWLADLSKSTDCTVQDIDFSIGPDVTTNRSGFKIGGRNLTLRNLGLGGGRDMLYGASVPTSNLHLFGLRAIADPGGNFFFGGGGQAGLWTGFIAQDWNVVCGMPGVAGIAHPFRLYDLGPGALLKNNLIDTRSSSKYFAQYVNAHSTSGIRLHRGTAGLRVEGGAYYGSQNWFSPLHADEPPLANVVLAGVTIGGSTNINGGATNILIDGCKLVTGASWALSLGDGSSGRVQNSDVQTTAQTPIFNHTTNAWAFSNVTRNGAPWR